MSTENDDIDLVIDEVSPDTEPKVEVKVEDKKAAPEDIDTVLEDMRAQLRDANVAREAAEERARAEANRSSAAQRETVETQLALVTNAIDTVKQQQGIIKAQWSEAMAVGDFATAAELQEQMAMNAQRLTVFEQGKQGLEQQKKAPPAAINNDPVEALASSLTPKSAAWVRAHPEFAKDRNKYNQMIAAHQLAVSKGIAAESDDYFDFVERTLEVGQERQSRSVDLGHADAQRDTSRVSGGRQASAPPAAPPSRSSSTSGGSPTTVRLTKEEIEIAGLMGLKPEEYARNKVALQKQGRMN